MWLQRTRRNAAARSPGSASENTTALPRRRRGRAPLELPDPFAAVLDDYIGALATAPLAAQTRRTCTSKVRQCLAWLADADLDKDPLASAEHRDWAVRDYRTHLQAVLKRSPATVNNALAAVDDLYIRDGLGPASAARVEISAPAPRALDHRAQLRYLRAVQTSCPSPGDQALALVPFYAGARISVRERLWLRGARERHLLSEAQASGPHHWSSRGLRRSRRSSPRVCV